MAINLPSQFDQLMRQLNGYIDNNLNRRQEEHPIAPPGTKLIPQDKDPLGIIPSTFKEPGPSTTLYSPEEVRRETQPTVLERVEDAGVTVWNVINTPRRWVLEKTGLGRLLNYLTGTNHFEAGPNAPNNGDSFLDDVKDIVKYTAIGVGTFGVVYLMITLRSAFR